MLRNTLDEVQRLIDKDPHDDEIRDKETIGIKEFEERAYDEECFLKQKAKTEWLKAGDSNTTYFHNMVKSKNKVQNREDSRYAWCCC